MLVLSTFHTIGHPGQLHESHLVSQPRLLRLLPDTMWCRSLLEHPGRFFLAISAWQWLKKQRKIPSKNGNRVVNKSTNMSQTIVTYCNLMRRWAKRVIFQWTIDFFWGFIILSHGRVWNIHGIWIDFRTRKWEVKPVRCNPPVCPHRIPHILWQIPAHG